MIGVYEMHGTWADAAQYGSWIELRFARETSERKTA